MTRGRATRTFVGVVLAGLLGVGLAACSLSSGSGEARQACTHVNRSIVLYRQATRATGARTTDLEQQAYLQLRIALPIAAEAASANGQWQALMTTLSETNRVAEGYLITALTDQCQVADNSIGGEPPPPSSVPPPAPPSFGSEGTTPATS